MNLNDEGIIISLKKFSDSASLMKVLTKNHGIYSGLIRLSKKSGNMGVNVPGNIININYRRHNINDKSWRRNKKTRYL